MADEDLASNDMDEYRLMTEGSPEEALKAIDQPRDEAGRFAPKAADAPAEPVAAPVVAEQQPAPAAPVVEAAAPAAPAPDAPVNGMVPLAVVQAEREKRQALERQLADLNANRVQAPAQPAMPAPVAQPEPEPEVWDDPRKWLDHQISPFVKALNDANERIQEFDAREQHGREAVAAAKTWIEGISATPEGQAIVQAAVRSPNPFVHLVDAHKQSQVRAQVGDDPNAYFERELARRMADPAERAKLGLGAAPAPAPGARPHLPKFSSAALPSGGPANANADAADDMTEYRMATARRR